MERAFTRRGLVAAAPAAIVAAAVSALAAGNDDTLMALAREFAAANALAEDADRRLDFVSARYDRVMPPEPEAIFVRDGDDFDMKTRPTDRGGPAGRRIYGPAEIEAAEVALEILKGQEFPGWKKPETLHKVARLQEIVDSHAAWRAERHATWIACGMEEAERASSAAHERCREVIWRMVACPAATQAGVMLKVRIAAHSFGDTPDEVEAQIDDVLSGTDTCGEGLSLSILRDLARIAERTVMGGLHA